MQKKVFFRNSKGQRLVGVLHIPPGKGPFPAVIVQHGLFANHQHPLIKSISCALEKAGFVALRFTWSGHKPSEGAYQDVLVSQFVKDLKKGLAFLKAQTFVNQHRLGIIGHSLGAYVALIVASLSLEVRTAVAIASLFDAYKQFRIHLKKGVAEQHKDYLILRGRKVPKNHYQDRAFWKINKKVPNIHCPLLIIHGDNDKTIMVQDARQIYRLANQPKELKIVRNGDHNFHESSKLNQVVNQTVYWCKKYLAFKF